MGLAEKVYFQHTVTGKNEYRKDTGILIGLNDKNNMFLICNKDGVYASPHVMKVPDDQAYNLAMLDDVSVQYYDYIDMGVLAGASIRATEGQATAADSGQESPGQTKER